MRRGYRAISPARFWGHLRHAGVGMSSPITPDIPGMQGAISIHEYQDELRRHSHLHFRLCMRSHEGLGTGCRLNFVREMARRHRVWAITRRKGDRLDALCASVLDNAAAPTPPSLA